MSDIIVEQLAVLVGTSGEELVKQLQAAGVNVTSPSDSITDQQKTVLLNHLQQNTNESSSAQPTLSLNSNSRPERKPASTASNSKRKATVTTKVRRKRPAVRRTDTAETEHSETTPPQELVSNRSEQLAKQLEAERRAREMAVAQQKNKKEASLSSDNKTAVSPSIDESTASTEISDNNTDTSSLKEEHLASPSAPTNSTEEETHSPSQENKITEALAAPVIEEQPNKNIEEASSTVDHTEKNESSAINVVIDKQINDNEPQDNVHPNGNETSSVSKASTQTNTIQEDISPKMAKDPINKPTPSPADVKASKQADTASPSTSTPVTQQPHKPVDMNFSFEAARKQRDSVAAAAKEEAASLLKRRPSRKKIKTEEEKPKVTKTAETNSAAKTADTPAVKKDDAVVIKRKKRLPSSPTANKENAGGDADSRRGRRRKNKQSGRRSNDRSVKVERSTEHAFEKPTAPDIHEIQIPESVMVSELARMLSTKSTDIIKQLMKMGMMATINQTIDQDTAILLVEELGHKATPLAAVDDQSILAAAIATDEEFDALPRPPVVTIMGHVDHGKTSLLDYIRSSRVASGEAGGITQHIGAYHVETDNGIISFLDTPGHAAFTAMRARGAKATDIVILVVAADDGVMPQTIEAIKHTRAAGVPLVVAINKIDKPDSDLDRVKTELSNHKVIPEDWGGDDVFIPISAKTGEGIDDLLESITLVAELQELKAPVDGPASGIVVEASIEKGRGAIATVLVQQGTLKQGDMVLCGKEYGRIRAMLDENGQPTKAATPSIPVSILGLSAAPSAGDEMIAVANEKKAREIADMRREKERDIRLASQHSAKLESLMNSMADGEISAVNVLLKADVQGSVEALRDSLTRLSTDEVRVKIVASGVGGINESDASLAQASNAIVIGFNVRADATSRRIISEAGLDLRYYSIIYEAIDDVKAAMSGLLAPETREVFIGLAEVKDVFRSSSFGEVAGCIISEGVVRKGNPIRILRDNVVIFEGELESLRRHRDDVNDVRMGTECGIAVKNYNNIQAGDSIECFERTIIARKIE